MQRVRAVVDAVLDLAVVVAATLAPALFAGLNPRMGDGDERG
ncbi:hypothetical protein [Amycolatopsis deserti]|nr:hypothetical protein [Amycolatopsis deserti]